MRPTEPVHAASLGAAGRGSTARPTCWSATEPPPLPTRGAPRPRTGGWLSGAAAGEPRCPTDRCAGPSARRGRHAGSGWDSHILSGGNVASTPLAGAPWTLASAVVPCDHRVSRPSTARPYGDGRGLIRRTRPRAGVMCTASTTTRASLVCATGHRSVPIPAPATTSESRDDAVGHPVPQEALGESSQCCGGAPLPRSGGPSGSDPVMGSRYCSQLRQGRWPGGRRSPPHRGCARRAARPCPPWTRRSHRPRRSRSSWTPTPKPCRHGR